MQYKVSPANLNDLRLGRAETAGSVLRNIAVILSTRKGSVPLYRDFGLSWDALDKPEPIARAMLIPEIREAIERWEPRAEFIGLEFRTDPGRPGTLIPIVEVSVHEQES